MGGKGLPPVLSQCQISLPGYSKSGLAGSEFASPQSFWAVGDCETAADGQTWGRDGQQPLPLDPDLCVGPHGPVWGGGVFLSVPAK